MKIDRVIVFCSPNDLWLTKICVASIRYWNQSIPVQLHKDESRRKFDTRALEKSMNITVCDSSKSSIGNPMSKFYYVTNGADTITGENIMIMDSDTAWFGDIIPLFHVLPEDVELAVHGELNPSRSHFKKVYFDPNFFESTFPGLPLPPFVFNSGHFVVKIGAFDFDEAIPFLNSSRKDTLPQIFPYDQGIFNFLHAQKRGLKKINSKSLEFAKWPGIDIDFGSLLNTPFLVHWAGKTNYTIAKMRYGNQLQKFQKFFLDSLPIGDRIQEKVIEFLRISIFRLRLFRVFILRKLKLRP